MGANTYDRGSRVRVFATFRSTAGTAADPTTVRMKYRAPGSTLVTLTYSTSSSDITRSSTGTYYADVNLTTEGSWHYQWDSSGTIRASAEARFRVRAGIV